MYNRSHRIGECEVEVALARVGERFLSQGNLRVQAHQVALRHFVEGWDPV